MITMKVIRIFIHIQMYIYICMIKDYTKGSSLITLFKGAVQFDDSAFCSFLYDSVDLQEP